jgi:hypothetical protein
VVALAASAGPIDFGTVSFGGAEIAIQNQQFVSQGFDIGPLDIASINLYVRGNPADQFTMWLTDSNGPGTTSADVIAQVTVNYPDPALNPTPSQPWLQLVKVPVNMHVAGGFYFIVLSTTDNPANPLEGWWQGNNPFGTGFLVGGGIVSQTPNINSSLAPASRFNLPQELPMAFQIEGPNPVPEPSSIEFLGIPVVGLLFAASRVAGRRKRLG